MNAARKRKTGRKIGTGVVVAFFSLYAVSLLYPLFWAFLSSLKTATEYMTTNRVGLPQTWEFKNYVRAFQALEIDGNNMFSMLFNSLWFSLGGTFAGISVSTMVAYVVAKYRFPGGKAIYWVAIVTMMIPIVGAMPSQYRIYEALGLLESPLLLIAFAGGFGFNFMVLYSFFKSLPTSYIEAGFIDGAGHFTCFLRIMLPQALPVVSALALVAGIGMWNDYTTPLLFLKNFPTLASGLYMYQIINTRNLDMPVLFAGILISMLPIVTLFIAFQNSVMDISLSGGLKG